MRIRLIRLSFREAIIMALSSIIALAGLIRFLTGLSVSYADDLLTVFVILSAVITIVRLKKRNVVSLFVLPLLFTSVGLIGNYINTYQYNKFAIFTDLLGWQKFMLLYACFNIILSSERINIYLKYTEKLLKLMIVVGVIQEVLNLCRIVTLAPGFDRFGLPAFTFGMHPSNTSSILALAVSVLSVHEKKNKKYIYLAILLGILTFRFKSIAFGFLAVYFLFKDKIVVGKNQKRIPVGIQMIPLVIAILIISWEQIQFYFVSPTASRARALVSAFYLAKMSFPVGGGFATFGTQMSGAYYSSAYQEVGLSSIWGFTKDNYDFIGDGGFATIIGQFGYAGLLAVITFFVWLLKYLKKTSGLKELPTAELLLVAYLIISQSNEGALCSENAPLFALMLAIFTIHYGYSFKRDEIK